MTNLAPHLTAFLQVYLPNERRFSRHTVQSYTDCFRLLVLYAAEQTKTRPCALAVEHLTVTLLVAFLESGDIPGPRGHQLGLGVAGMTALIAPLSHRLEKARAGEHVEDVRAFGCTQGPGGRRTGLLMPGSGPLTTVEGSPWHPQRCTPAPRRPAMRAAGRPSTVLPVFEAESQQPGNFSLDVQDRMGGVQLLLQPRQQCEYA